MTVELHYFLTFLTNFTWTISITVHELSRTFSKWSLVYMYFDWNNITFIWRYADLGMLGCITYKVTKKYSVPVWCCKYCYKTVYIMYKYSLRNTGLWNMIWLLNSITIAPLQGRQSSITYWSYPTNFTCHGYVSFPSRASNPVINIQWSNLAYCVFIHTFPAQFCRVARL